MKKGTLVKYKAPGWENKIGKVYSVSGDCSLMTFSNASGEVIKELQKVYRNSLAKVRYRISRELFQIFELDPAITEIKNKFDEYVVSDSTIPAVI